MKRFALTLDLKNEKELIDAYISHHRNVWPEVIKSIRDSGIQEMEIFNVADRLFMIISTQDDFSFDKKSAMDKLNQKVQDWETLMDQYQRKLPFAKSHEKWVLMTSIFSLT